MAADVGPGDEVIVPSFTFFATASAVTRQGARPIFADIDPVTYNVDPEAVAKLITPRTRAMIPVHLFGQMAPMRELNELAAPRKIAVIEDAAQSIGAELEGRRAGCWGDMGALSFYPTKNLGGAGDGGLVTTRDDGFAQKLRLLHVHGMEPRYYHGIIGINSRLDSFQAAILNVKMKYLEGWTMMRAQNAMRYHDMLSDAGLDKFVGIPETLSHRRHVWNQYTVRIGDGQRDELRKNLAEKKIGSEIYYPLGLHEQECFRFLGYAPESLPETYRASREVLALPIYPELTENEQRVVVRGIKDFYEANPARHLFPVIAPDTKREAA